MPKFKPVLISKPALSILLLLLPVLAFYLPQRSFAQASKQIATAGNSLSASEMANQLAGAYGGMAKIKEMMNRGTRSHGRLNNMSSISSASNVFECELLSKGDKLRVEMEILGQKKIEAYDGKSGWSQVGNWVSRLDGKTVQRVSEEMKLGLNALERLDDPTCKLEVMPAKEVNGKKCELLKLTGKDGKWTTFYIDPLTKMVLRSEFMGMDSEQGMEALKTIDYSDYRNLMGFPTPFKVVEYLSGRKTQEATIDSITFDDSISDDLFAMPEESRFSRLERGPITVPFEYSGNEIIISARVNGGPESKFIVDTGASQTVIDKTTAQALGPTTVHTFSVTAGAKAVPLSYTTLDRLQIGDLPLEGIATLVTDLSSFSAAIGQRPAGLIGANILRRFLVTIDFQDKKLVLADPSKVTVPDSAIVVPTSPVFASTGLVVNGNLDGVPMNFLVDTGAAFNNLPLSLAEKLNTGSVLPVGQIHGLDGQKTSIGSIKLKSLKLDRFIILNPVFALQPDRNSNTKGLFSAASLGILGNPVWSATKLCIDYRNDRLIIELPAESQKLEGFIATIEDIDRNYYRNKNIDEAAGSYEKLMNNAHDQNVKAAEALALSRLASLYGDKYHALKESRWLDTSAREYERAAKLAAESRNKTVEGQILAQWAMLYLNFPRSNTDLISSQNLLKKALTRAPMDGSIYAALGSAMLKTGKNPTGAKFIDQALMLDPSNWQALWSKYKLLESEKKYAEIKLLLLQINRYYPDFPQIKEAQANLNKQSQPTKAPAKKTGQRTPVKAPVKKAPVKK